ncbi:hypothetical protein HDU85_006916 [Gaertneriomyces sp. JEL0708]|nr:hypothetical protein HDU85_006916 [Gaertneriomyces sp. JEL0708]
MAEYTIVSPHSLKPYRTIPLQTREQTLSCLSSAHAARKSWAETSLSERTRLVRSFLDHVLADRVEAGKELTHLIGRPISHVQGELDGFYHRGTYMCDIAQEALQDVMPVQSEKSKTRSVLHKIVKEPIGVILVIAAWNYPYLVVVNSIVPALLAGNVVLLKHAPQTFPVGERLAKAWIQAGGPADVFQSLTIDHTVARLALEDSRVGHVVFTGSVRGGKEIRKILAEASLKHNHFPTLALELGGKDAAYVCDDADIPSAVEGVVEGVLWNAGQSCCGVERVLVHESVYPQFVALLKKEISKWTPGDPFAEKTMLGPVVTTHQADAIRTQVDEAVQRGGEVLPYPPLPADAPKTYIPPTFVTFSSTPKDVITQLKICKDESFGPIAPVIPVSSDVEALAIINDSEYGLTSSVWSKNLDRVQKIGASCEVGTVYANRCDAVDPEIPWGGWKGSGSGVGLSRFGFDHLTRLKSYNLLPS